MCNSRKWAGTSRGVLLIQVAERRLWNVAGLIRSGGVQAAVFFIAACASSCTSGMREENLYTCTCSFK